LKKFSKKIQVFNKLFRDTSKPLFSSTPVVLHLDVTLKFKPFNMRYSITINTLVFASSGQAAQPPRGWNSYDSYTWFVNETQYLSNCEYMADHLLEFGFDTCVIDYLWYKHDSDGSWELDDYCMPTPALERWPSASKELGLKPIADKVHAMGLRFGIHIMRGSSIFAKQKNCRIKNSPNNSTIRDIILPNGACSWMNESLSVDVSNPDGALYYDNLYNLYADWGVDFIKNDCMFGKEFVKNEVLASANSIENILKNRNHTITYSLSAGAGDIFENVVHPSQTWTCSHSAT